MRVMPKKAAKPAFIEPSDLVSAAPNQSALDEFTATLGEARALADKMKRDGVDADAIVALVVSAWIRGASNSWLAECTCIECEHEDAALCSACAFKVVNQANARGASKTWGSSNG
jgi:hypothetical protein